MVPPKPKPKPNKKQNVRPQKEKGSKTKQEIASSIPAEFQQVLLNIFKNSFSDRFESDIRPLLQEVKGHLYNRDFLTAFGKNEYLEAYAARWSPSRALGYSQVFNDLKHHFTQEGAHSREDNAQKWKIVCLGGGAGAEIVALGGFRKLMNSDEDSVEKGVKMEVVAIDIADWSQVVEKLTSNIVNEPPLSKYASAAALAANAPLTKSEDIAVTFHQYDILNTNFSTLSPLLQDAKFITLMFTLNELYSTSLSLTQKFLLNLAACLQPGSLLLVVDSPGSYSTISLNGAEKKYPMQWLLDHTLLKQGAKGEEPAWNKLKEDESQWFRLPPGLMYPIELENMRFQLHLYRRTG